MVSKLWWSEKRRFPRRPLLFGSAFTFNPLTRLLAFFRVKVNNFEGIRMRIIPLFRGWNFTWKTSINLKAKMELEEQTISEMWIHADELTGTVIKWWSRQDVRLRTKSNDNGILFNTRKFHEKKDGVHNMYERHKPHKQAAQTFHRSAHLRDVLCTHQCSHQQPQFP